MLEQLDKRRESRKKCKSKFKHLEDESNEYSQNLGTSDEYKVFY